MSPARRRGDASTLQMVARLTFGLLMIAALASCEENPHLDTLELSGRVTVLRGGAGAGDPIAGATVSYISDTLIVSDTMTDDAGRYRMIILTDVPFGQVRASADGFIPAETTVLFDTPQRRIDLELRPMP